MRDVNCSFSVFHPKPGAISEGISLTFMWSRVLVNSPGFCSPVKRIYRQQDEELDELSASVERIGGVGLTIHEELLAQVHIS